MYMYIYICIYIELTKIDKGFPKCDLDPRFVGPLFLKLCSDTGYRQWADVASQLFGGLDILTVDAIIEAETGKVWFVVQIRAALESEFGAAFLWSLSFFSCFLRSYSMYCIPLHIPTAGDTEHVLHMSFVLSNPKVPIFPRHPVISIDRIWGPGHPAGAHSRGEWNIFGAPPRQSSGRGER